MATLLKNKVVKTKKQHECFSCLRVFPTGTKMNYQAGVHDGDFSTCYSCMTCVEIMNASEYYDDEGFGEGYVDELLNKGQTPEEYLNELKKEV